MIRQAKYYREMLPVKYDDYLTARDISAILRIPIVQGDEFPQATVLRLIKEIAYRIERLENE